VKGQDLANQRVFIDAGSGGRELLRLRRNSSLIATALPDGHSTIQAAI
jgi:hypothetical protein